jgi:hypothetical protein
MRLSMSVLSTLHVLALILGSSILFIAAVFGAIVIRACLDRRPRYSYFVDGVSAPTVTDKDTLDR